MLINLDRREYKTPEEIGKMLAKYQQVESVDIITGGWELIVKVRTKDIEEYYEFSKKALLIRGIDRTQTLSSLLEIKSEFVG